MADSLALRQIDNADRAFQTRFAQIVFDEGIVAEIQKKPFDPALVKQALHNSPERAGRTIFRCGGSSHSEAAVTDPCISRKANQHRIALHIFAGPIGPHSIRRADSFAWHERRRDASYVPRRQSLRVVFSLGKMPGQSVQRFGHVLIAKVPRRSAPIKHRAIIFLRVFNEPRILFGEKIFIRGERPIALGIIAARRRSSTSWEITSSSHDSIPELVARA